MGRCRRMRARRGFSLLEVIVVVIVIGVVAGVVVPNLGGSLETVRLNAAARRLSEALDYAHQRAVTTGRVHCLTIAGEGRELRLLADPAPDTEDAVDAWERLAPDPRELESEPELEDVRDAARLLGEWPEGVAVVEVSTFEEGLVEGEEDEARIFFFPDGTCEFARLRLESANGGLRDVALNGLNGGVTVRIPEDEGEDENEDDARGTGAGEAD